MKGKLTLPILVISIGVIMVGIMFIVIFKDGNQRTSMLSPNTPSLRTPTPTPTSITQVAITAKPLPPANPHEASFSRNGKKQ
ncbi:MAG: hypothetical protein ACREHC_01390 [Candidatus Levyibacteriota bacterium]